MDVEAHERFLDAYLAAETLEEALEIERAYEASKPPKEKVAKQMLRARTMEEIEAAEKAARDWIKAHPEDFLYIGKAGGSLQMKREGLESKRERLS